MRRMKPQQVKSRVLSPHRPPAELPLPQTSTLRSRKRLANILVVAGIIYAICWLPHVYCLILREFSINEGCSIVASEFFMLLGELNTKLFADFMQPKPFFLLLLLILWQIDNEKKRFRSFSSFADNSLGTKLQFIETINLSTICEIKFSSKVFEESTKIYGTTSSATLEHER